MSARYPSVDHLLRHLQSEILAVLGSELIGLYLFGSLVWGDFDMEISDIDLMAVVSADIGEAQFTALEAMHAAFTAIHPEWDSRIEVGYISREALLRLRKGGGRIAVISPGEPLNVKDAGKDWLINTYIVLEKGIALFGLPLDGIIDPITKTEFIQTVKDQAAAWDEWVVHTKHSRPYQAYAILTLCRALYACATGEQPSKLQAARWVMDMHPDWAGSIQNALRWRAEWRRRDIDSESTYPETEIFVKRAVEFISCAESTL